MEEYLTSPEVQFELKRVIENQFSHIAQTYSEINSTSLNTIVQFSPDLLIVAVDLETISNTPFFMNVEILRILERAIVYFADHLNLIDQGIELVEPATVEANNLSTLGRLHKENTRLHYQTSQPFIFRITAENLVSLLSTIHTQLKESKSEPDYIEKIEVNSVNQASSKNPDVFQLVANTTKTPITHRNHVVMGVTLKLRNINNGCTATLHIPNKFMPEFTAQPSARITSNDGQNIPFAYYDWLVGEDELINLLQSKKLNTCPNFLESYIKQYIRYDVGLISVQSHYFEYYTPTSNYAPITAVSFVAVLQNQTGLFEYALINANPCGEIKVINSRGLTIYPPKSLIPYLDELKQNIKELFTSNHPYTRDQIKQLRIKMNGFNRGLAIKNEYIYLA